MLCSSPPRGMLRWLQGYLQTCLAPEPAWHHKSLQTRAATMQYVIKACVRGFSEIPTDAEFESGDLSLVMDDFNPGHGCPCLPGCFKRLTVNAKVHHTSQLYWSLQLATIRVSSGNCSTLLLPNMILVDIITLGLAEDSSCNCGIPAKSAVQIHYQQ